MTGDTAPKVVAWFTGLSGAGKSTIAALVAEQLTTAGIPVTTVDGDAVRARLTRHLGFSADDIRENNRCIADLCVEALATSDVVLVPVIAPLRDARAAARMRIGTPFVEVQVLASLATVSSRDPKGLYADVRDGRRGPLIGMPTAVPYETPEAPEVTLDTEQHTPGELATQLTAFIVHRLHRQEQP